jgi:hypothetical protein
MARQIRGVSPSVRIAAPNLAASQEYLVFVFRRVKFGDGKKCTSDALRLETPRGPYTSPIMSRYCTAAFSYNTAQVPSVALRAPP